MPQDIVAAIVAYLQAAMGQSLASSTGSAQVYADYAPQANPDGSAVAQPYCVVTEGNESYSAQSDDHVSTGYYLSNLATGTCTATFYATTKEQARTLGRTAVRVLTDSQDQLNAADGRVVTLLPLTAQTVPLFSEGVAQPTAFARVVTVQYVQQFLE